MIFTSDNAAGVAPDILAALARANAGAAASYGADEITRRLQARFAEIFEREVLVHPVATGTAANALAVGLLWVVLTVGFDLTLGSLAGLSWERIAADFDLRQGGAMPVGLAVMLFAPLLALSLRRA